MQIVQQALATLVARPEVDGAALVSAEGLIVAAELPAGADPEALAALSMALVQQGSDLARAASRRVPERLLLESPDGVIVACPLADGAYLMVLGASGASAGRLLFDLRQVRGGLTALL